MKELKNKDFIDWFNEHLGFGYGTGDGLFIKAVKGFLDNCPESGTYDYEEIAKKIGDSDTWWVINLLCRLDMIEYGSSPRYAWLTEKATLLKSFVADKTESELYDMVMVDSDYVHCSDRYCNCGPNGYELGRKCDNPLFK